MSKNIFFHKFCVEQIVHVFYSTHDCNWGIILDLGDCFSVLGVVYDFVIVTVGPCSVNTLKIDIEGGRYSRRAWCAGLSASWTWRRHRPTVCGRWALRTWPTRRPARSQPVSFWWTIPSTTISPRRSRRAVCPRPAWCSSHPPFCFRPATPGRTTRPSRSLCSTLTVSSCCACENPVISYDGRGWGEIGVGKGLVRNVRKPKPEPGLVWKMKNRNSYNPRISLSVDVLPEQRF